ncbi:MAG: hypothetical protein ACRDAG_12545 [Cetobacterium somerae]|uniref:hypothetical protein n=1 Tax=Cetobacterium somerae TaxID=188913 RepID=UPI003F337CD6
MENTVVVIASERKYGPIDFEDEEYVNYRFAGNWPVNKKERVNYEYLIGCYKGTIVRVYKIIGFKNSELEKNRTVFDIVKISSSLIGKSRNVVLSDDFTGYFKVIEHKPE